MYELWARRGSDNKDFKLCEFYDKEQFHFMIDQVDRNEYSDATILEWIWGDSLPHCAFYQHFPSYEKIRSLRK